MLPEEICLTSTPKRPNLPQSMATPAPVSMSESVETVEAKAALKQVHFSVDTAQSCPYFFLLVFGKHFYVCSLLQLQEVFENYKKEKAENDKLLNEQNEKLQEQVTDLRSQNAKISTQLEFASKR